MTQPGPDTFQAWIYKQNPGLLDALIQRARQAQLSSADCDWLQALNNNLREWLQTAAPPPQSGAGLGMIFPGGSPITFGASEGQTYFAEIGESGSANWSVSSGNQPCWMSISPAFPLNESMTRYGSGTTDLLPVTKGQIVYMKHDGPAQNARVSMV